MNDLNRLPQEIQPGRDLWSGIEPRLVRRSRWQLPASLAAAAVLAALGIWMSGSLRDHDRLQEGPVGDDLVRALYSPDGDYQQQRAALLRELPGKLERLPPESRQHVQESLQSIEKAMRQIEAELGRDAGNVLLQELLISTSQEEMRVLGDVSMADDLNGRT